MKYQLLPELSDEDKSNLRDSIEARGVDHRIVVDENGEILDGHNRKEIADDLGIECPSRVVHIASEAAKRAYVLNVNLARRNLTNAQKRDVRNRQKEIAVEMNETHTQEKIAVVLGVPQQTVNRWLSDNTHVGNSVKPNHRTTPPEKVAAVLAGLGSGKIAREVSVDTGVPISTIYDIRKGHSNAKPKTKTYPGRKVVDGVRTTLDTFVGLASGLDGVSVSDAAPTPEEALMWDETLGSVVVSINRFRRQIKEHYNGR